MKRDKAIKKLIKKIFTPKAAAIEDVQKFGVALAEIIEGLIEIDKDGDKKVDTDEILTVIFIVIQQAATNLGGLGPAFKQLGTSEGRDAFKESFKSAFDLENVAQEAVLEGWLDWLDLFFDQLKKTKEAF